MPSIVFLALTWLMSLTLLASFLVRAQERVNPDADIILAEKETRRREMVNSRGMLAAVSWRSQDERDDEI